jgi:hypothetical protein
MKTTIKRSGWAVVAVLMLAVAGVAAQGRGALSGNPTPGTPQPAPPNLADRITVTGCVQFAAAQGRGAVPVDQLNAPSDAMFVLTDAVREGPVRYRLSAINSALVPFVGSKVEMSGEVDSNPSPSGSAQAPILHVGFARRIAKTCS